VRAGAFRGSRFFFLPIDELVKWVRLLKLVCLSSARGWVFYVIPMMKSGQEKGQGHEQGRMGI
jgi:hypothetical protein